MTTTLRGSGSPGRQRDMTEIRDGGRVLFTHAELACKATGVVQLHPGFDDHLHELRIAFGHPMFPRSCCRSAAHNRTEKGHRRSLHVYDQPYHFKRGQRGTLAIDVAIPRGELSVLLLETALALGWSAWSGGSSATGATSEATTNKSE